MGRPSAPKTTAGSLLWCVGGSGGAENGLVPAGLVTRRLKPSTADTADPASLGELLVDLQTRAGFGWEVHSIGVGRDGGRVSCQHSALPASSHCQAASTAPRNSSPDTQLSHPAIVAPSQTAQLQVHTTNRRHRWRDCCGRETTSGCTSDARSAQRAGPACQRRGL